MTFSIVIPIYNEAEYLNHFLKDLLRKLNSAGLDYEIILSENGSQDHTLKLAQAIAHKNPKVKVISSEVPNYGLAVKNGFLTAHGKYLVLFDLDYYDVSFLISSLPLLKTHSAVIGAKHAVGSVDKRAFKRRLITYGFSLLLKLLFGLQISDTHGIKVLNRLEFTPLIHKSKLTREIFDTELLIRSEYEGMSITEIPVIVSEKRSSRTSILKRAVKTLRDLFRLKMILSKQYD